MGLALATFLGSFFLFFIQPFMGKLLTPALGGGPQVWLVCLVYFQVCLVLGYGLAHALTRLPGPRRMRVQALLVLGLAAWLAWRGLAFGQPFSLAAPGRALAVGQEALGILALLASTSLLPLILLGCQAPLVQGIQASLEGDGQPYRLYAYSNAGSLLGLFFYPFVAEPRTNLGTQGWVIAAGALVATLIPVVVLARRAKRPPMAQTPAPPTPSPEGLVFSDWGWWGFLAMTGTLVLMSGTALLTHKVGAFPLVWILPLGAFLLTFILVFDGRGAGGGDALTLIWSLLALVGFLILIHAKDVHAFRLTMAASLAWVFGGCMVAHRILFRARPHAAHLTGYYLAMSVGGAIGGLVYALVPPLVFDRLLEPALAPLLLGCVLMTSRTTTGRVVPVAGLALVVGAGWGGWMAFRSPGVYARDFFSTLRAYRSGPFALLENGKTVHGAMDSRDLTRPVGYYGPTSGLGRLLGLKQAQQPRLKLGVVGLGVGSAAGYLRPSDQALFYEISPAVNDFCGKNGSQFAILRKTPGTVDVRLGDGRLLLAESARNPGGEGFDVLLVDAFSGDSVPWHLLTCDALRVYFGNLKPGGVLLLHLSNPLPLSKLVLNNARAMGLHGLRIMDVPQGGNATNGLVPSTYMVLSLGADPLRHPELMGPADILFGPKAFAQAAPGTYPFLGDGRPWTDERNSLTSLLF